MSRKRKRARNNNNRKSNVDILVQASQLTQSFATKRGNLLPEESRNVKKLRRSLLVMTKDKRFGKIAIGFIRIFNEMDAMNTAKDEKDKLKHFAKVDAIFKKNARLAQEVVG